MLKWRIKRIHSTWEETGKIETKLRQTPQWKRKITIKSSAKKWKVDKTFFWRASSEKVSMDDEVKNCGFIVLLWRAWSHIQKKKSRKTWYLCGVWRASPSVEKRNRDFKRTNKQEFTFLLSDPLRSTFFANLNQHREIQQAYNHGSKLRRNWRGNGCEVSTLQVFFALLVGLHIAKQTEKRNSLHQERSEEREKHSQEQFKVTSTCLSLKKITNYPSSSTLVEKYIERALKCHNFFHSWEAGQEFWENTTTKY